MKLFIARVALLSSIAFGAILGGGVAFDGAHVSFSGPSTVEAKYRHIGHCYLDPTVVTPDGEVTIANPDC